jgi:predicted MPP superfamily phosphohydrolase
MGMLHPHVLLWYKQMVRAALQGTGLMSVLGSISTVRQHLEISHHWVDAPVDPPLRVALLTDLHIGDESRLERAMFDALSAEPPDMILIAGDVTSPVGSDAAYRRVLNRLRAPQGVWMVRGNWDYWTPMLDEADVLGRAGVRLLENEAVEIAPRVWLVGIDDAVAGQPDPARALQDVPEDAWIMALFHCPITFDSIAGRCRVGFAGHTHGPRRRMFGLPLWKRHGGGGRYEAGWYERGGSRLYVSRGLATPSTPVRLGGQPELAMFTFGPHDPVQAA